MVQRYVLMTAAKNEERYIGTAIESVLRQTVLPAAWFIMDDGSSDNTARIVERYAIRHPFIRLHSNRSGGQRSFGAQYRAINAAYGVACKFDFDYVGVQDADIEPVANDYYERVLSCFENDPTLGLTGGYIHERSGLGWECRKANSPAAVAGGIQMFRRTCYERVGGYTPLLFGGEDWLAQIDARVAGWGVCAQIDLSVRHHRPTSSADGRIRGLFRLGMMDASFGSHWLFEILKCARRIRERPLVLASGVRLSGYLWGRLSRRAPLLPPDKVAFLQREQLCKVRELFVQPGSIRSRCR